MAKSIAVIGAGPKAAAIAAKAQVLRLLDRADIRVTIFEKHEPGANWTGEHGYTDGHARLCTPAERDLGFPYDAGVFDRKVAKRMYAEYSWGAYLVGAHKDDGEERFNDWINRGRLPPRHSEFAKYVQWAITKSTAKLEPGEVTGIERGPGGWVIRRRVGKSTRRAGGPFAGVVLTGPGPAQTEVPRLGKSDRILNGETFWKNPSDFLALSEGLDDPVVIVGAGGTAAAIAAWFVRAAPQKAILIIGNQAALFTRSHTFFEGQIFTDEDVWDRLDINVRTEFTRRLNRGVVWATVSEELSKSRNVRFEPGRVDKIVASGPGPKDDLNVFYHNGAGDRFSPASLVVDASGFEGWWFKSMLPADLQAKITHSVPEKQTKIRTKLLEGMDKDFTLFEDATGRIHAPMLSQAVGPGFSTLMVLGAMSDRILKRY